MKLFFSFLFLVMALLHLPADAKSQKKVANKTKPNRGIIKITDYPKGKTVKLLRFKQLQKLEYWNRVRYIEQVRQTVIAVDAIQKKFGVRYASLIEFKENRSYASIFEPAAYAQGDHGRGSLMSDGCIASGNMSVYKNQGQSNPFGCKPIACKRADGASGRPQLRCGFVLTGLSGDNGCVPKYNSSKSGIRRHSPTEDCWERSTNLYESNKIENGERIEDILKKAREMKQKSTTEVKNWLKSSQAKKDVKWLKEHAYDPRALAHLVGFAQTYAAAGLQDLVPELHQEWDALVSGIDNILTNFKSHCDETLTKTEAEDIVSGRSTNAAPAGWTRQKEQSRYEAALKIMNQRGRSSATVREVLQIPECKVVDERLKKINENIGIINSTYPIIGTPVPERPKRPPAPPKPAKEVEHLGCTDVYRKEHYMPQSGMRCVACAAERAMIEKSGDPSYYVSRKWLSLVSTMALVCGDGCMGSRDVNVSPEMAQEYVQSFGHCDDSSYSWHDARLSASDERMVEQWGEDGGFVRYMDQNSDNTAKLNADFYRIYGAQLDDLIPYFCNTANHKTWSKARNKRCSDLERESPDERYKRRREGLKSLVNRGGVGGAIRRLIGWDKNNSPALQKCFESSLENAEVLYSGTNSKCMSFVRPGSDGIVETQFMKQAADGNGNFASLQGQCSPPKQIEYTRSGNSDVKTRIVWQHPRFSAPNPNNGEELIAPLTYYEKNRQNSRLEHMFLAGEALDEQDEFSLGLNLQLYSTERSNHKLAILNPNACPGGRSGSASGSRSTRGSQ